jgi:hypothetical protein
MISAALPSDDSGEEHVCPDGFMWGGLSCVPEDADCSDGYFWDGEKCAEDGEDCADGYYLSGGDCIDCPTPSTPTISDPGGEGLYVTASWVIGDEVKIYISTNGAAPVLKADITISADGQFVSVGASVPGNEYCAYYLKNYTSIGCGWRTSKIHCIIVSVI